MNVRRLAMLLSAGIAAMAGAVALVAAALSADTAPRCETFPGALDRTATHRVCGPLLERYLAEGGPTGKSGRPLENEQDNPSGSSRRYGDRVAVLERGAIYLDSASGRTTIPGVWTAYTHEQLRLCRMPGPLCCAREISETEPPGTIISGSSSTSTQLNESRAARDVD